MNPRLAERSSDLDWLWTGSAREMGLNMSDEAGQIASNPGALTSHRVHEPEINPTGPTTAPGIWAFDDVMIYPQAEISVHGAAFYEHEYVRFDERWSG